MPKIRKWLKKRRYQPSFALKNIAANAQPLRARAQFDVIDVPNHRVPYDENLLDRARTQWQFGDWDSLTQLDLDTLQHHPDRAKLALLAAAGRLQTGQAAEARKYIRLAQDWGVSKKLLTRVLAAGVHNSLGRAAAIAGEQHRALLHFQSAISTGSPGSEARLLAQARISQQYQQLGLGNAPMGLLPNADRSPTASLAASSH